MAKSDLIRVPDYNDIRDVISQVMTNSSGTYGYGQALNANEVAVGNFVTKAQWDALRYDIINALLHQTGTVPNIATPSVGDEIAFGDQQPNRQYLDLATIARNRRFDIGSNQYSIESLASRTQDVIFNVTLQATVTVSFTDANRARWFFNSGGKIRLNSSFEDTLGTDQSYSWTVLTSNTGTPAFGADTSPIGFYSLTNQDKVFFTYNIGGIYNQNSWRILVRSDVADNSNGGATQLIFTVQWVDSYADLMDVGPGDQVAGRMTLNASMLKPTGILYPGLASGSFSVLPPSGTVISQFESNFSLPYPVIRSFYSIPNPTDFGSPSTLQWRTRNSIYTWIEGIGSVPNTGPFSSQSGQIAVSEPFTKTFTLHASNRLGEVTSSRTVVINPAPVPRYVLSVSPQDYVNEGGTVTFTLRTENVSNGTVVPFTLSGISSADISGAPLSGSFTVNNGLASVTYNISSDLTSEPRETFTLELNGNLGLPVSVKINDTSQTPVVIPPPTVSVSSNVNSVIAGSPIVFTITTSNATLVYSNGSNLSSIATTKNVSSVLPIGEVIERPPSGGSYVYVVTAIGPGGTTTATKAFTVTIPAPPPPPPEPEPPAPCVNPPNTSDQYAVYQTGMVLIYSSGYTQSGNILVSSTKTTNASIVNGWYQSVIGRPAENPEWQGWITRLNNGESTSSVYSSFVAAASGGELAAYGRVSRVLTYCEYQNYTAPPPPPPRRRRTVTVTLTSSGSIFGSSPTWTVPDSVTSVEAVLIGAGAGGSSGSEGNPYLSGGGGGGSGGIITETLSVTPGSQIRFRCGRGGAGGISTDAGGVQGSPGGSTFFGSLSVTGGLPSQSGIGRSHYNDGGPAGPGGSSGESGQTRRQETSSRNIMAGGNGGGVPGYSTGGAGGEAVTTGSSAASIRNGGDGNGPGAGGGGSNGGRNDAAQGAGGNGTSGIIYLTYTIFE
jgi:hypothetical protein